MPSILEYSKNLNLTLIPAASTDISFLNARKAVYGNEETSNMQKIDTAFGDLSNKLVYVVNCTHTSGNAYSATNNDIKSIKSGLLIIVIANISNTGAVTLAINSFETAKIMKVATDGTHAELSENDLLLNKPLLAIYNTLSNAFLIIGAIGGASNPATLTDAGIVKLTNATNSTSESIAPTAKALADVKSAVNVNTTNISGKAPISHTSTDITYGVGTNTNYGHVKLYNTTGNNADGAITQAAATSKIANAKPVSGTGISVNGVNGNVVNIVPPTGDIIGGVKAGDNVNIGVDGTISVNATPTTLPPSGNAGGDLTGMYPNPTVANNIVNDDKIGNRTVDQAITTVFSSTGKLSTLLSFIVKVIKSIVGKDNWYDTPETTIAALHIGKANLASPTLTGTPTAPTATSETNTTQIATTAFVKTSVANHNVSASNTVSGHMKIYTTTGQNTDGSMTQKAVSDTIKGITFTETDPTVPAWAKTTNKPTYTATETGADVTGTANATVSTHNSNNSAHSTQFAAKLDKSGGTITGTLTANDDTGYTTSKVRNSALYVEASIPTTGNNGAIVWGYS